MFWNILKFPTNSFMFSHHAHVHTQSHSSSSHRTRTDFWMGLGCLQLLPPLRGRSHHLDAKCRRIVLGNEVVRGDLEGSRQCFQTHRQLVQTLVALFCTAALEWLRALQRDLLAPSQYVQLHHSRPTSGMLKDSNKRMVKITCGSVTVTVFSANPSTFP